MEELPAENAARQKALENVNRFFNASVYFPEYVFKERWGGFLFFDPGWVTHDKEFVEEAKALMEIEGAQCVCIAAYRFPDLEMKWPPFFFNRDVTASVYQSFLDGPNSEDGPTKHDGVIMSAIGRFVLASDVGQWCIYCENEDELAVIAIRDGCDTGKYMAALTRFHPQSLEQAIATPNTYSLEHMPEEYRNSLLKHYALQAGNSLLAKAIRFLVKAIKSRVTG